MLLEIKDVTKVYGEHENKVKALDRISLQFNEGEFVSVMGSSGSGKTTLLNCISSIDKPTSGDILINGKSLINLDSDQLAEYRAKNISFIFQSYNLITNLTVYENIILPLQISKKNIKYNQKRIDDIMSRLSIKELKSKFPNQLSGGQQQRVATARAIINSTNILIADEPTGALDSSNSDKLMHLLRELNKEIKLSILMVTHDPLAAKYSSKVIFLSDGRIIDQLIRQDEDDDPKFLEKIIEKQKYIDKEVR
ncbi:MAG: ABC transporter ATP-binding protein [Anaerococcus sp.]|nr:ABC transporter ATP-binding protein [Anaerococcus sp.]